MFFTSKFDIFFLGLMLSITGILGGRPDPAVGISIMVYAAACAAMNNPTATFFMHAEEWGRKVIGRVMAARDGVENG